MFSGLCYWLYYYGLRARSEKWGQVQRSLYDGFQRLINGVPFPRRLGKLPEGAAYPSSELGLVPGDYVKVKSYEEILQTLDRNGKNKGMYFDAEMVPACGRVVRVRSRIDKFLDEKTGKLVRLKTPAVILDDVFCEGRYSDCRMFCPRSIYSWWREVWLERVPSESVPPAKAAKSPGEAHELQSV
jgi:hypothetical protein